ncbi:MAG: diguanylate cyclase [Mitsuaria chitosanitabida]|uniref:diguanylate cyclase domain-containing protein n=1 Tax=Roseateles chitosanitabidus TaxID=65048 RepID=UPI001B06653A|nr:diguanylate cyclase [Roseateles chitosanitabidus]MBO9685202.1 diguanylate cyclase [Roseateles chitosanitabidus]
MTGAYDAQLVALSIVTAVIASFVALDMATRVASAAGSRARSIFWLACGAMAMGTGIWAMHFVGMLAFSLPIALAYDPAVTLVSWIAAALSSALALHTISGPHLGTRRLLTAGTLMGLGIACMHYLGMHAMQMRPGIRYQPGLFLLSIALAVAASTAALRICFQLRHETILTGPGKKAVSALVMGAAIVGMHYTGMAAADFSADSLCGALEGGIGGAWLAFVIAGLASLFLLTTLLSSIYEAMPPTIRSRLVFLVVAAVLPSALLTLALVVLDFQRLRDLKANDQQNAARAIAAALDKDLGGIESGLRVLAGSTLLRGDSLGAFYLEAQDALPALHANALLLEDDDGRVVMDTRRPWMTGGPERSASVGALQLASAVAPTASGSAGVALLPKDAGNDALLDIAIPLPTEKQALFGATRLRARLSADRLKDLLAIQQLSPDWIATVYDRHGLVMARSRSPERFVGGPGPDELVRQMYTQREGLIDTMSLDGVPVRSVYVRSGTSGWSVSINAPLATLNAPPTTALAWLLAGFAVTVAGSLLLAWRIGGRIAGAVQALTEPALALGTGVPVQVPPLGVIEVDRVGRALAHAAQLLDRAQHEANHDALTGLANRALFRQMVQQHLALAHRNGNSLAVLYVDLDGFKEVNDTHGHRVGDELLQQTSLRLLAAVRAGDLVARLGGDEFAIALVQPGPRGSAKVAAKLVHALAQTFQLGELRVSISASIGGATVTSRSGDEPGDCDALLQRADAAMYQAKQSGKSRYVLAEV